MIIYAPSYHTLWFALKKFHHKELTLISNNESIVSFCQKTQINCLKLPKSSNNSLRNLYVQKKKIAQFLAQFTNEEILFCFNTFDVWGLYFVSSLKKRNNVYYHSVGDNFKMNEFKIQKLFTEKNYGIKFFDRLIFLAVLGKWFNIYQIGKEYYTLGYLKKRLSKKFLDFSKYENYNFFNENKLFINSNLSLMNSSILWIDDTAHLFRIKNKFLNKILSLISDFEVSVKPHPSFNLSSKKLSAFNIIPKEVPAEYIKLKSCKLVIGYHSSALSELANDYLVCSIFKLVEWVDYDHCKHLFNKGVAVDKRILAPRTIEEFKTILNNHLR